MALLSIAILLAYLCGSVPFGLLFAKARGVDLRGVGSGNIGATNVARALGRPTGALVLLLDAAKGAGPMLVARHLDLSATTPYAVTAVGLAAIAGHCFPVWLRFRGGKGVATSLGVSAAADPLAIAIALGAFALVYAATRYVSAGSLVAALVFVGSVIALGREPAIVALAAGATALILALHHQNIRRLLRGTEHRLEPPPGEDAGGPREQP